MPGEYLLLTIAIDDYRDSTYPEISNAKHDVERFSTLLIEKYGFSLAFDPIVDSQATHKNILDKLFDLNEKCTAKDNLIIYYAGHGIQDPESKVGYWIPYGARNTRRDYINNSQIIDEIKSIPAKHILLISDSCFSGAFVTRGSTSTLSHSKLDSLRSRWIFTSGGEEKVLDGIAGEGSPFNNALCEYLEQNVSPTISAGELFNEVTRMVSSKYKQRPLFDEVSCELNQSGQMIFRLSQTDLIKIAKSFNQQFSLPSLKIEHYIPRYLKLYDHQKDRDVWFYKPEIGTIQLVELIKTHKHVVVLGGAGSGKSIELLYLAHELQKSDSELIPIYKRFNSYTDENIKEFLPKTWDDQDPGNLIIFLDGLDEVQPTYFQTAVRKILKFVEDNPLIRIVISCRTNFYELPYENFSGTINEFSVYNLLEISMQEVERYVTTHCQIDGTKFIENVYNYNLTDLVQKPFFLNILIGAYKRNGDLGNGRSTLMEEALTKYYNNDKEHFNTTISSLNKKFIFEYLERIAFVLEILGKNFITDSELAILFPIADDFERCKYFPAFKRHEEQNNWSFEHNNIQEYLAARVLSGKSLKEIIDIISTETGNEKKIKPTWLNTLSFFISNNEGVAQELLDWLIEHDKEIVIKFDIDRLTVNRRIKIFKEVFDFYTKKGIWIHSNKFSSRELARFGEADQSLEYLLSFLEKDESTRIEIMSSLDILRAFQIKNYAGHIDRIKSALTSILLRDTITNHDVYTILGTIADLKIEDPLLVNFIIKRFELRHSQYVRAGLYKLLLGLNLVDDYIDVFVYGITLMNSNPKTSDRESFHLADESIYFERGIKEVKSANSLLKLLEELSNNSERRNAFIHDYPETSSLLITRAELVYTEYEEFYQILKKILVSDYNIEKSSTSDAIFNFLINTGNRWKAFIEIWNDEKLDSYIKGTASARLINTELVEQFISHFKGSDTLEDNLKALYSSMIWRNEDVGLQDSLSLLRDKLAELFNFRIEVPVSKDWEKIHTERNQDSFNLLFDVSQMESELRKFFNSTGSDFVDRDIMLNYQRQTFSDVENRVCDSAIQIVYHLMRNNEIFTIERFKQWINSNSFLDYTIKAIHSYISNKKSVIVNDHQREFISDWSIHNAKTSAILWDLVNKLEIKLSEDKFLDFTTLVNFRYDFNVSEPGSIEQLEKFVAKDKILERVFKNIQNLDTNTLQWINNASYAVRHNYTLSYSYILQKLECSTVYEYKFSELLSLWFSKTNDNEDLKKFSLHAQSEYLRWKAIQLLENTGKEGDFIIEEMLKILESLEQSEDSKVRAANHLMEQNDIEGFFYLANHLIKSPDPKLDFRIYFRKINELRDPKALNILIELLELSKLPEFKKDDFNRLEDSILAAFQSIGTSSNENFLLVKRTLEQFIADNTNKIKDVNFLYYAIQHMEEKIKKNATEKYTIQTALAEYQSVAN